MNCEDMPDKILSDYNVLQASADIKNNRYSKVPLGERNTEHLHSGDDTDVGAAILFTSSAMQKGLHKPLLGACSQKAVCAILSIGRTPYNE
ncbi:MAG: hypothetical protein NC251_01645 [Lachnoclostridium sp.]|nr:hypothetical protein [Lachnospira sp.]MCM1247111.1 hypothetical protein [Lachnoclostridium sp.]